MLIFLPSHAGEQPSAFTGMEGRCWGAGGYEEEGLRGQRDGRGVHPIVLSDGMEWARESGRGENLDGVITVHMRIQLQFS